MNAIAVVFDTNAYRNLAAAKGLASGWNVTKLRLHEEARAIKAFANPFVVMELLSRMHDPSDPDHANCRAALMDLVAHSTMDSLNAIRLVAPSEDLMANFLYGANVPGSDAVTQAFATLACRIASSPESDLDSGTRQDCKTIADYVSDREAAFVEDMQQLVIRLNPAAAGWHPFSKDKRARRAHLAVVRDPKMRWHIALGYVMKARTLVGKPLSDPYLDNDADKVLKVFGTSVALYQSILERIVATGCDVSSKARANWIWDMQVVFAIGQRIASAPGPLVLITGDRDIRDAARKAAAGTHVMDLAHYLAAL